MTKASSRWSAAEFLEKCQPRLKSGFGIGQADVDYYTLTVDPKESKSGKAPDEQWQKPGRMNHFYIHWKRRVDGMRKLQQTMNMAALNNAMGSMYKAAMNGAAVNSIQQQQLQRRLTGP